MFDEGLARPGAMAAILGKLDQSIESLCEHASRNAGVVVPANYNTDEQIVVSGEVSGVERVMQLAKEAGAKRAVRLPVSGAFHSPLMEPAEKGLRDALAVDQLSQSLRFRSSRTSRNMNRRAPQTRASCSQLS